MITTAWVETELERAIVNGRPAEVIYALMELRDRCAKWPQAIAPASKPVTTGRLVTSLSFEEVTDLVIQWVNNNCNPHAKVIIDSTSAELVTGDRIHNNDKFVKD